MYLGRGWHLLCRKENTIRLDSYYRSIVIKYLRFVFNSRKWELNISLMRWMYGCRILFSRHIHNRSLQSFSQDYWRSFSHHLCCVCVNFIHKWRYLQFEIFFMAVFIYSVEFLPEICWEEIAEEIIFVFCFDIWPGARILALRLISQHATY